MRVYRASKSPITEYMPRNDIASQKQCNAKSKTTGEKCRGLAVTGSDKCRMHNGKALRGVLAPNFKTGKYSRYLPTAFASRVEDFKTDPELTELRENLALQNVRLTEIYREFDETEPPHQWALLQRKYASWQEAEKSTKSEIRAASGEKRLEFERYLREGLDRKTRDEIIWRKIEDATERRRRLIETESKRIKDANDFISAERFHLFAAFIISVINDNITDTATRKRIAERIRNARC